MKISIEHTAAHRDRIEEIAANFRRSRWTLCGVWLDGSEPRPSLQNFLEADCILTITPDPAPKRTTRLERLLQEGASPKMSLNVIPLRCDVSEEQRILIPLVALGAL